MNEKEKTDMKIMKDKISKKVEIEKSQITEESDVDPWDLTMHGRGEGVEYSEQCYHMTRSDATL